MSAQPNTGSAPAQDLPERELLADLARVHRLSRLIDSEGRIQWASDGWRVLCGNDLARSTPVVGTARHWAAVRKEIAQHGYAGPSHIETVGERGAPIEGDVCVFPLLEEGEAEPLLVAVARPTRPLRTTPPAPNSLLDSVSDAILAVDGYGFVTSANPAAARLLGMPLAELHGLPLAVLPCGAGDLKRLLRGAASAESVEVDVTLRRKDGTSVRTAAALAPHRQADGSVDGTMVSLRDVTEQRLGEADLARRNEELEHCVNTLAHDLRSPLVALLGFSRLLRQDYGEHLDDTGLHFIDRIEQAGRTMESLIHDLLELSRIGQAGERRAMVDPRPVLLQIAAEFKPPLDSYGIGLTLPEDPPLVFCDRTRLYQVFSNLIDNAIHHMGECEDPWIRVEIEEDAQAHRISVRDSGCGVAAETHERIFEVFQSLGPRRDGGRGTGIGLAIVRKIAQTHNGRAWVESHPGHGAVFHVTLPRP